MSVRFDHFPKWSNLSTLTSTNHLSFKKTRMSQEQPLSPELVEHKKQVYLQRIHELYRDLRTWLKDLPLQVEESETGIHEALGRYQVPVLTVKTAAGELLAAFKPTGASVLLAEGAIDVKGLFREYVVYMVVGYPQQGYFNLKTDGWYWMQERLDVDPHLLNNPNTLLQLITWVSDYEFE